MKEYEELKAHLFKISQVNSVMGILHWDQEIIMPSGAVESRANQLGVLSGLAHQLGSDPRLGEMIQNLKAKSDHLDLWQKANLREAEKEYLRLIRVPESLTQEMIQLEVKAHNIWIEARKKKDFSLFAPFLEKILNLSFQWAQCIDDQKKPYHVYIDVFEPGMNEEKLENIFSPLKKFLFEFLQQIEGSPCQVDTKNLTSHVSIQDQERIGRLVIKAMGFSFERGRLDTSVHPFCGGGDSYDVRITTRYDEKNFASSLMAMMHETGHALYEQGRPEKYIGQPVSEALSMGIHESQSLLWEKQVGQSKAFWKYFYPILKTELPDLVGKTSESDVYAKINQVKKSMIRVDADEVTYPLHVMLRFEIEKALFAKEIQIKDLPQVWNDKMKEYLGIVPADDAEGVLQDVHWSGGSFGYFPSYTLGALYAAQFYHSAQKSDPTLSDQIARGEFLGLKKYLNDQIHCKASLYSTDELCQQVSGEKLNSQYFIDYLKVKYSELYSL